MSNVDDPGASMSSQDVQCLEGTRTTHQYQCAIFKGMLSSLFPGECFWEVWETSQVMYIEHLKEKMLL